MRYMLRTIILLTILLGLFALTKGETVSAQTQKEYIAIALNDQLVSFSDAQPELIGGTTYLPLRAFAEAIGATVEYDVKTETVQVVRKDKRLTINIPDRWMTTSSGLSTSLPLYLKKNRLMVPFRTVADLFEYKVSYFPQGPIARARDGAGRLEDAEVYLRNQRKIAAEKAKLPDKVAYLTFDDGPNEHTAQILDTLARYEAQATFFMLARQIESHPREVKRMASAGHGLALHGVTHNAQVIYASAQSVVNEMEQCNAALTRVTGIRTNMARVPYGSKPWMSQSYRDRLVGAGYRMWDWNVDSYDSRSLNVTPDQIVREVVKQTAQLETPVILLHDRKATLAALPRILTHLQASGYDLRPLKGNMPPLNFWNDRR